MPTHPQVVHFAIALLLTALLTDILSYFLQKEFFNRVTLFLLALGTVAAFAAVQTGQQAEEADEIISGIDAVLDQHENAGEWILRIFGAVLLMRIVLFVLKKEIAVVRLGLTLLMVVGAFFIYQAGLFGGQMVYSWGAGVEPVMEQYQKGAEPDSAPVADSLEVDR